jgi:hypothetical protein
MASGMKDIFNKIQEVRKVIAQEKEAEDKEGLLNIKNEWIPYLVLAAVIKESVDGHSKENTKQAKMAFDQSAAEREEAEKDRKHQRYTQLMDKVTSRKE